MKYQNVRGTHDLFGNNLKKFQAIEKVIYKIAGLYSFQEIRTPIFEFAEIFEKNVGENTDIINKEMYIFHDKNNEKIALRPEGTAPVVRALLSNGLSHKLPLRFFYLGPMFRYERPQKGRQRQFHQVGFEYLGTNHYSSDVEMILLAVNFIKKLGIKNYELQINSLGSVASLNAYKKELIAFLQTFKKDLSEESQLRLTRNPLRILDSKSSIDQQILLKAPLISDSRSSADQALFKQILEALEALEVNYVINEKLVRGLDYYNHSVFEIVTNNLGAQGTLVAGGRYNHMLKEMSGPDVGCCGFAAGLERLALMLPASQITKKSVALITKSDQYTNYALKIANTLRLQYNISVQYILGKDIGTKLKKTSPLDFSFMIIIGEEEYKTKNLILKNLTTFTSQKVKESQLQDFLPNN